MEFKGTKGKWKFDKIDIYSESKTEFIDGNLICIAPDGFDNSMVNWKANAKLIESAPEMFDMLNNIYTDGEINSKTHREIKQLLTKITE